MTVSGNQGTLERIVADEANGPSKRVNDALGRW